MVDPFIQEVTNALLGVELVIALVLTFLGALSYRRTGNPKLAWVTCAFAIFLGKSSLLLLAFYQPSLLSLTVDLWPVILDVIVLVVLYLGVVRAGT